MPTATETKPRKKRKGDEFAKGEPPDTVERAAPVEPDAFSGQTQGDTASIPGEKKWPAGVEKVLRRLRNKREWAKAKLTDSVSDRDAYKTELRELGKERTKEKFGRALDLFEALEMIDYCRFVIKQCADKMDKAIGEAEQGKLFPDVDGDIPSQQMWLKDMVARAKDDEPGDDE